MKRMLAFLTFVLVALVPTVADAGGWAVASLDPVPAVRAGQPVDIGFVLLQLGETPVVASEWSGPTIGLDRAGLAPGSFDAAGSSRPDMAGTPPEGGVLFAWPEGDTTRWVRPGDDDVIVVKRLIGSSRAELIPDLGDFAVLVDDEHVLDTPSRHVAAGRVLWWLADGRQWRLESDLDRSTMLVIARALASP